MIDTLSLREYQPRKLPDNEFVNIIRNLLNYVKKHQYITDKYMGAYRLFEFIEQNLEFVSHSRKFKNAVKNKLDEFYRDGNNCILTDTQQELNMRLYNRFEYMINDE